MKALLLTVLFALPGFASALEVEYPTINVYGVPHYIADADDSTGEWFASVDGYCANNGLAFKSGFSTIDATLKPLAVLNAQGQVVQILPDNKSDQVWVLNHIVCE